MNADLARASVYNKLTQKRITAIADIRNNAAHGYWDQFDQADVKDMIDWVATFVEAQDI
jgi:DNA-binding protein Fis